MAEVEDEAPLSTEAARLKLSRIRTNHLGVSLGPTARSKYKHQRTITIVYDAGSFATRERDDATRTWRLLQDTRCAIDGSTRGLRRLFLIFREAAPERDQSLLGPRAFRQALAQYGVRDPVLVKRLFKEFSERAESEDVPVRIDCRHFLRNLLSINQEPTEDVLALMFDLWDLDDSGTLTHAELAGHVIHDLPVYKRDRALEVFNRVWVQVRNFALQQNEGASMLNPQEVTRDNLISACQKLAIVTNFFDEFLVRRPPKVDEVRRSNLLARMSELDAEVREEVRNERSASRPSTAQIGMTPVRASDGGHARRFPTRPATPAADAIISTLRSVNSSALGIMKPPRRESSSPNLGRSHASDDSQPPLPDVPRRPGTTSQIGRAARMDRMHSFVKNAASMPQLQASRSSRALARPSHASRTASMRAEYGLALGQPPSAAAKGLLGS